MQMCVYVCVCVCVCVCTCMCMCTHTHTHRARLKFPYFTKKGDSLACCYHVSLNKSFILNFIINENTNRMTLLLLFDIFLGCKKVQTFWGVKSAGKRIDSSIGSGVRLHGLYTSPSVRQVCELGATNRNNKGSISLIVTGIMNAVKIFGKMWFQVWPKVKHC